MRLILMVSLMLMLGCELPERKHNVVRENITHNLSIIEIDNCEYVLFREHKKGGITHKGNCKNPFHKQQADTINSNTVKREE